MAEPAQTIAETVAASGSDGLAVETLPSGGRRQSMIDHLWRRYSPPSGGER